MPDANPDRNVSTTDIFNGDADGLIARHQFRLAHPDTDASATLITGVKRDIALLERAGAVEGDVLNVFDISWDQNAAAGAALLAAGVHLRYFDHHGASRLPTHPGLEAYIDHHADICTSLIVDRHIGGAHRQWAIAGAFGDNLLVTARALAAGAWLSPAQTAQLQQLGECLNYNAYGDTIEDLHFPPATLARLMQPYADPFAFLAQENVVSHLADGYASDLAQTEAATPSHADSGFALYVLPDQAWARRASGIFANQLVHRFAQRAHAVVTPDPWGSATVSIRAPRTAPYGADTVARLFPGGGGRAAAAGVNRLPLNAVDQLAAAMSEVFHD